MNTLFYKSAGGNITAIGSGGRYIDAVNASMGTPPERGAIVMRDAATGQIIGAGLGMDRFEESKVLLEKYRKFCETNGLIPVNLDALPDAAGLAFCEALSQLQYASDYRLPAPTAAAAIFEKSMTRKSGELLAKSERQENLLKSMVDRFAKPKTNALRPLERVASELEALATAKRLVRA